MTSSAPMNDVKNGDVSTGVVMTSSAAASPVSVNDDDSVAVRPEMTRDEVDERPLSIGSLTSVPREATDRLQLAGYELEDISDPEDDSVPVVMARTPNVVWSCYAAVGSTAGVTGLVDRADEHREVMSSTLCTAVTGECPREIETRVESGSSPSVSPTTVALPDFDSCLAEEISTLVSDDVTVDKGKGRVSDCPPELVLGLESTPDRREDCAALKSPGSPSSARREQSSPLETAVNNGEVLDNVVSVAKHIHFADEYDGASSRNVELVTETPDVMHCKTESPSVCGALADDVVTAVEDAAGAVVSVETAGDFGTITLPVKRRKRKQIPSLKSRPQRQDPYYESSNHSVSNGILPTHYLS